MSGCVKTLPSDSPLPPTIGISAAPGIATLSTAPSVGRLSANSASKMSAVAPSQSNVMPMPITIWSRPQRTQKSTISSDTPAPAAMPAAKPYHSLPPW